MNLLELVGRERIDQVALDYVDHLDKEQESSLGSRKMVEGIRRGIEGSHSRSSQGALRHGRNRQICQRHRYYEQISSKPQRPKRGLAVHSLPNMPRSD